LGIGDRRLSIGWGLASSGVGSGSTATAGVCYHSSAWIATTAHTRSSPDAAIRAAYSVRAPCASICGRLVQQVVSYVLQWLGESMLAGRACRRFGLIPLRTGGITRVALTTGAGSRVR
jgi:hypothetical protein